MKRIATFVLSSCVLFSSMFGVSNKAAAANVKAPEVKIAVFSDPHYYAPQLGTSGKAFEDYLAGDRKLLAESEAILEETINSIKKSDAQIVLVSGDLTKDGEMVSHTGFANYLKDLEKNGKKVYVIAGNHDINNPDAVKFQGDKTTKVARASASDFKRIYANYGYKEAISRDPYSLSYVVEPVKGLWILVMDSALYNTNLKDGHPTTGGAFSQKRLDWIKTQLKRAKEHHKVVLGMTHHGVVQHFSLQEELFSDYVISDWDEISSDLADLGLKAVLTGHFHANDVVKKESDKGNFLFDIETGSLVTYPSPYRMIELTSDGKLHISTKTVDDIDYDMSGKDFPEYAKEFLVHGLNGLVPQMLAGVLIKQGVKPEEALKMAEELVEQNVAPSITVKDVLVNAMVAHYAGDESSDKQTDSIIDSLLSSKDETTQLLGSVLASLLHDPNPSDNNLTIDLESGEIDAKKMRKKR